MALSCALITGSSARGSLFATAKPYSSFVRMVPAAAYVVGFAETIRYHRQVDYDDVHDAVAQREQDVFDGSEEYQVIRRGDRGQVVLDPELARRDFLGPDFQVRPIQLRDRAVGGGAVDGRVASSLQDPLIRKVVGIGEVHRGVALRTGRSVLGDGADPDIDATLADSGQQGKERLEVGPLIAGGRHGVGALVESPTTVHDFLDQIDVKSRQRAVVVELERRKRRIGPKEQLRDAFCRRREDEPTDADSGEK